MINGNAPKIEQPDGVPWRTVRNPDPSMNGFSRSGARRTAARSRELHRHLVSNAVRLPWIARQQAVAHGLGTVDGRERVI